MATDPRSEHAHNDRARDPHALGLSYRDAGASSGIAVRSAVRGEITSLVLCGPAAVVLLVLVARHGWPVWWLVIAGMLLAWAGDAAWNLVAVVVDTMAARRAAEPGGEHR